MWLYLLLCVLPVTVAHAATRKYVSMPSDGQVIGSGRGSSVSGDILSIPGNPIEGEYIPSSYGGGSKGTKLPVQPQYQYVKSRTIKGMAGNLRGGVYGAAVGIGLQYMLDAVDGFIEDNKVYVPSAQEVVGGIYWYYGNQSAVHHTSAVAACQYGASRLTTQGDNVYPGTLNSTVIHSSGGSAVCDMTSHQGIKVSGNAWRVGNTCPADSTYNASTGACVSMSGRRLATDADYSLMEAAAAAKDSEWLKERLKEHCEGSIAPGKCYESLRDSVSLTGPSSVQGPTQTTTGTYTKPDGTTGTTGSTTSTNYNIKYGDNYYDYSKSVTTTKTQDGQKVSEETTTESEEPTEEDKPQDDPAPCVANCDGPAYQDQYTPTDVTKESEIDSYIDRVKAAPILSAGSSFFAVSVSGSCPVWEVHESLTLFGETMAIDLVFDFHCRPWFIDFQPYAAIIMAIGCAFFAFRIAMLD